MKETYRGTIYPWECDIFNHLNVQHYVAKFDQASWQWMAHLGMSRMYYEKEQRGIVAMEQHIRYYKE